MISEKWKPVIGFEGRYEVSDLGNVRSVDRSWVQQARGGGFYLHCKKGQMLRPGVASNGYLTVMLGRHNSRTVHSLVAEAFIGPCPIGQEVMHADDNRQNPKLSNLSYGTRQQNVADMDAKGRARHWGHGK